MPDIPGAGLVLDTHVWIWMVGGAREKIGEEATTRIEEASGRGGILVSAISIWETAMLHARGRISLAEPVEEWVRNALRAPGTRLLELAPEIAIESTRLPAGLHGDPADRILIASARFTQGRLVTCDRKILEYGGSGHVAVLDARP